MQLQKQIMKITVTTLSDEMFILDVSENLELENFKAFCEIESGFPSREIIVVHEGRPLMQDHSPLKYYGLKEGDVVLLQHLHTSDHAPPSTSRFSPLMSEDGDDIEREKMRIKMLNADPFDVEAQRIIAEEIRLKNVEANMEAAIEHNPESFVQVTMLYINCKVNGHPIKAFVDSGAQTTIMSQACAESCNIMRLVDTRWAGLAKGVGTQRIIGRVHLCQIQIEDVFLISSFSILEHQPMDMMLGLDMLKKHQCVIDLQKNALIIGSTGTITYFLRDSEIPECAFSVNGSFDSYVHDEHLQEEEDHQLAEALHRSEQELSPKGNGDHPTEMDSEPSMGPQNQPSSNRGKFWCCSSLPLQGKSDLFPPSK